MLGVAVTVAVPLLAACDAANQGAWAAADEPRGAVLVIHENRDLTDHIRSVALRLAASGYSVLAVDLLSEQGGTASFADDAEVTAALNNVPDSRFVLRPAARRRRLCRLLQCRGPWRLRRA